MLERNVFRIAFSTVCQTDYKQVDMMTGLRNVHQTLIPFVLRVLCCMLTLTTECTAFKKKNAMYIYCV